MSEVHRYSTMPQHLQDDLAPSMVDQSPKVHTGIHRSTAGGDSQQEGGTVKYTQSQDGTPGGSVVSTLSYRGASQSVELYPGRPESRTSVEVAAKMGLIRRDAFGQWQDVEGARDAVAQVEGGEQPGALPEDLAPADLGAEAFTPEADAAFQALVDDVPQHSFDSAMAGVISALGSGQQELEGVARRFAESAGMEPSQASQLINQAIAYYSGAASRALSAIGMTAAQQDAFFGQLQGPALTQVFQELAYGRSAAKLVEEAGAWRAKNPGNLDHFHAMGFETHVSPKTGEVLVRLKQDGAGWQKLSDLSGAKPLQKAAVAPQQAPRQAPKASPAFKASDWTEVGDLTATQKASYEANGYQVLSSGRITYVRKL